MFYNNPTLIISYVRFSILVRSAPCGASPHTLTKSRAIDLYGRAEQFDLPQPLPIQEGATSQPPQPLQAWRGFRGKRLYAIGG